MDDDDDDDVSLVEVSDDDSEVVLSDADDMALDEPLLQRQVPFVPLAQADLEERVNAAVLSLVELTSLAPDDAYAILRAFKWDVSAAQEAWFEDAARTHRRSRRSRVATISAPDVGVSICNPRLVMGRV